MHWRTLVGNSSTISAGDLGDKFPTVTIESVEGGAFEAEGGKRDKKALISFQHAEKKLAANVINCELIAAMFGDEVEAWVGHRITLMADKVEVAGRFKGEPCVRVKGSPELDQDRDVTIALPQRRPFVRRLVKT